MRISKRVLDLVLVAVLSMILVVPFSILLGVMLIREGRPLFYVAERMRAPGRPFWLWKLRTMTVAPGDSGVSGGDKDGRITPLGAFIRRARMDEVPQLWNVLKGEMSLVGPRPPLREYVERFPDLYAEVLKSPTGITGLASLRYHDREEALLAACRDATDTDRVYATRCVPQKARLDLIYQRNWSLCFDLALIWETGTGILIRRFFKGGRD
ncbi:sugar transferase [Pseudorhodobacter turbinis]|uniref:Sugar transferase n=1 Tax=Pseudorhodobacter turbinis TaxID=2500533 RepID=A0A4P8EGF3_9RHOB|nr:sugar transferase [Pseudorhodobacter turbinis]QCO55605.1 sugar transferase [Pseudorhodobacter turbinis]